MADMFTGTTADVHGRVASLTKIDLLTLFRALSSDGSVGFDHERTKRLDCVGVLLGMYEADDIMEKLDGMGVAVIPAKAAPPVVAPDAASAQLAALIRTLAGGATIDADSVRDIVAVEVAKALKTSPITTIEVKRPDGTTHKVDGHTRPEFKKVLSRAAKGVNILLVGPAGCGKTHLAHQVAEALGRQFASISCTAGMSESSLTGWQLPSEGGAFEYIPSDFVTQYENGGVFLFDELDAADPNTLLFLNQALANGSFFLPMRKGATLVTRHPDFVAIGAANTFGTGANMTYAGRERLDESTLDRFRAGTVLLGYDETFERKAVHPDLLAWGWSVRKRINDSRLTRVMSTRFLIDATKLLGDDCDLEEMKETYFIGWKADEKMKVSG